MNSKIDEISAKIHSDIKGLVTNFKSNPENPESSRELLKSRIEEYLHEAYVNKDIYFIPEVRVDTKVWTHVDTNSPDTVTKLKEFGSADVKLFYKTGEEIKATDELVTPLFSMER